MIGFAVCILIFTMVHFLLHAQITVFMSFKLLLKLRGLFWFYTHKVLVMLGGALLFFVFLKFSRIDCEESFFFSAK